MRKIHAAEPRRSDGFPDLGRGLVGRSEYLHTADSALTRVRREKVGFVFQSFQLLPTLSVMENVELPLMLAGHKQSSAAASERLRWVEMDAYADRMPYQLSGGRRSVSPSPGLLPTRLPSF